MGVVAWGPLANGFLSGKYQPGQRTLAGGKNVTYRSQHFAPNADETLGVLLDVAKELGRSPAQVALRWILEQPAVSSVIMGMRTVEQAQDNLQAVSWRLEGEVLTRLDEVSRLPHRYPESLEKTMLERRDKAVKIPSP